MARGIITVLSYGLPLRMTIQSELSCATVQRESIAFPIKAVQPITIAKCLWFQHDWPSGRTNRSEATVVGAAATVLIGPSRWANRNEASVLVAHFQLGGLGLQLGLNLTLTLTRHNRTEL